MRLKKRISDLEGSREVTKEQFLAVFTAANERAMERIRNGSTDDDMIERYSHPAPDWDKSEFGRREEAARKRMLALMLQRRLTHAT